MGVEVAIGAFASFLASASYVRLNSTSGMSPEHL
jgi:hypothetical protein